MSRKRRNSFGGILLLGLIQIRLNYCIAKCEYERRSLIASLMTLCSKPRHTSSIHNTASVRQRHELSYGRTIAAFLQKFCSHPGSYLDCLSFTGLVK